MFLSYDDLRADEAARVMALAALIADVAHLDPAPLLPGEVFNPMDIFEGCYTGKVVAKNDTHVGLWTRLGNRVAILPTTLAPQLEVGRVYAVARWCLRLVHWAHPIVPGYDWLNAMDDFIIDMQRADRDLPMSGVFPHMLALRGDGSVAGWYRDLAEAMGHRGRHPGPAHA